MDSHFHLNYMIDALSSITPLDQRSKDIQLDKEDSYMEMDDFLQLLTPK